MYIQYYVREKTDFSMHDFSIISVGPTIRIADNSYCLCSISKSFLQVICYLFGAKDVSKR